MTHYLAAAVYFLASPSQHTRQPFRESPKQRHVIGAETEYRLAYVRSSTDIHGSVGAQESTEPESCQLC